MSSEDTAVAVESISAAAQQFDDLCQQFYYSWFRYHPEDAVDVGVYDFADQLKSYKKDDIGALIVLIQKMLSFGSSP